MGPSGAAPTDGSVAAAAVAPRVSDPNGGVAGGFGDKKEGISEDFIDHSVGSRGGKVEEEGLAETSEDEEENLKKPADSDEEQKVEGSDDEEAKDDDKLTDEEYFKNFSASDDNRIIQETFPSKLYRILHESETTGKGDIVSFLPHGKSFVVRKPRAFVEDIMPK
jgi:hypothetical protein